MMRLLQTFSKTIYRHKEIFLYAFFGVLTTLISILSFVIALEVFGTNEHAANVISWLLAVSFAFVTNSRWVFTGEHVTKRHFKKQFFDFYVGRLFSLAVEAIIVFVFITLLSFNAFTVKLAAQFIVFVMNYFVSKLWVFKTNC